MKNPLIPKLKELDEKINKIVNKYERGQKWSKRDTKNFKKLTKEERKLVGASYGDVASTATIAEMIDKIINAREEIKCRPALRE